MNDIMRNIYLITILTLRETFSRKIFIAFFAISTLSLITMGIILASVDVESFMSFFGQKAQNNEIILSEILSGLKLMIVSPLFGFGLFLSIFSVSSLIPNMLEKGNIDLLLSKPVARYQIIIGKFLGGTLVVFINIAYLVIGMWILFGIKFGIWETAFLYSIPMITFTFAVLYSLIIIVGILTKSSILAMMLSYIIFIIISPILAFRENFYPLIDSKATEIIIDVLYYIVPKTSELGTQMSDLSISGGIDDFQPILTSLAFMILILYFSIIIFNIKDY
ncbi:MAG: ABC transporter permease subunit [Melioribacteraceae bacterium]|nr:ABC transporter permease subunit [Melioribacteraceae bacterium]